MKRQLSDSEGEGCDDYDECSSPDTIQVSRKKRRGIIEKRRRDRINGCLVELRRLVPQAFEKQGSAKLEKAEILQMTVDHIRHLHQSRDARGFSDPYSAYGNTRAFLDYRIMGFRECTSEVARYLSSVEGVDMKDPGHVRILNHLENYLAQQELAINAAVAASAQMGIPKVSAQQVQPVVATAVPVMSVPAAAIPSIPAALPTVSIPYAPLTPPRASPDHLSPPASLTATEPLPRFSVAFPIPTTPIISFAPTNSTVPAIFRATGPTAGLKPLTTVAGNKTPAVSVMGFVKPAPIMMMTQTNKFNNSAPRPLTVITTTTNNLGNQVINGPLTPPSASDKTKMTIVECYTTTSNPQSPTKTTTKAPFRPWADSMALTNNA